MASDVVPESAQTENPQHFPSRPSAVILFCCCCYCTAWAATYPKIGTLTEPLSCSTAVRCITAREHLPLQPQWNAPRYRSCHVSRHCSLKVIQAAVNKKEIFQVAVELHVTSVINREMRMAARNCWTIDEVIVSPSNMNLNLSSIDPSSQVAFRVPAAPCGCMIGQARTTIRKPTRSVPIQDMITRSHLFEFHYY